MLQARRGKAMTDCSTHHETIVFECVYDAPVPRVYAAFADPIAQPTGVPRPTQRSSFTMRLISELAAETCLDAAPKTTQGIAR
jgi:hypothetical protein